MWRVLWLRVLGRVLGRRVANLCRVSRLGRRVAILWRVVRRLGRYVASLGRRVARLWRIARL